MRYSLCRLCCSDSKLAYKLGKRVARILAYMRWSKDIRPLSGTRI
nr:MAG TPA: hypothetical protein [Crassvirales sp.]